MVDHRATPAPFPTLALAAVAILWGCSGGTGAERGMSTGGQGPSAGGVVTGGQTTGGAAGSGGTPASGGTLATGGKPTGGSPTGGSSGTGGIAGTGGASGSGGIVGTGGTADTGGASGSGGMNTGGTPRAGGSAMDAAMPDPRDAGRETAAGGDAPMDAAPPAPGLTKLGETRLTNAGLKIVSYGGYLNGESFQQEGVLTFQGYQYTAFWNTARHVVMARRALPDGPWATFEFTDYTNREDDAHNTISLGICPGDGTLHLSFDHHSSPLHYRRSKPDFVTNPATAAWSAASFSATTSALVAGANLAQVTYPRFITEPGGQKMLFDARLGTSGSGDEALWEYDATTHAWTSLGMLVSGIADSINAYPHGFSYTPGGTRLHLAWCWRETSDAATNHDLFYAYSDDHGRTFKNNAGTTIATTGKTFITKNSAGAKVWTIGQNRGLINQEHMVVDHAGQVHVLLAHMPDAQADDSNFERARTKSQYFHYVRATNGTWSRNPMGYPVVLNFRGKLAIAASGNVYAILPDLRIAAAPATNFATWTLLSTTDSGRFFSDPLIDTSRLLTEDTLTVVYPVKNSSDIYVQDYAVK